MHLNWELWLYGLMAGVIGGASTAALSWAGLGAAHAAGLDVPMLNFKALGIVLLSGAAPSFFAYLKQQPLPPIVTETTITVTEKKAPEPVAPEAPKQP